MGAFTGVTTKIPQAWQTIIQSSSGTSAVALTASEPRDRNIDNIIVSNSEATAHVLYLQLKIGSVTTSLGSATIPASAGNLGNPSVDLIAAAMPASISNGYTVPGGADLTVAVLVAMTTGQMQVSANGALVG